MCWLLAENLGERAAVGFRVKGLTECHWNNSGRDG